MDARDIDSDSCHDNEDENWLETGWSEENPSFCVNQNYSKMKTPSPRHSMCKDNLGTSAKQAMRGAVTQDESNKTDSSKGVMSLMGLNTNKAGMEGLDKEKINSIILEASKGSKFYENEQKKEQLLNNKIEQMKEQLGKLTEQEKSMALVEVDKMVLELKAQRDLTRTIVHIDMDMFYAAVEMKDDPTLRDKPMAVGSMGMLSTSNYKARRFGVRAAMPGFIGKKLCPELILVKPNFVKYRAVSQEIQHIMGQYDPNFAAMSLDEAYLDLTEHLKLRSSLSEESRTFYYRFKENQSCRDSRDINQMVVSKTGNTATVTKSTDEKMVVLETGNTATVTTSTAEKMVVLETGNTATVKHDYLKDMSRYEIFGVSAEEAVREIRFRIEQKTQLTASAGIAPNTMLAKVCSDKNKPNGQYRIEPTLEAVNKFIEDLPIRKVSGIGKITEKMLNALGVNTCTDLYTYRDILYLLFRKTTSDSFIRISLGIGSTTVARDGERKSMSVERTFKEISSPPELYQKCYELCESLAEDLKTEGLKGKTITLKIKLVTFETKTRAVTVSCVTNTLSDIYNAAKELLRVEIQTMQPEPLRLRLMGVRMSSFISNNAVGKQGSIKHFLKTQNSRNPELSISSSSNNSIYVINAVIPTQSESHGLKEDGIITGSITSQLVMKEMFVKPNLHTKLEHVETIHASTSSVSFNEYSQMKETKVTVDREDDYKHTNEDLLQTIVECNSPAGVYYPHDKTPCVNKETLTCPVCNSEQKSSDLFVFNSHVDMCLNKKAIQNMLQNDEAVSPKLNSSKCYSPNKRPLQSSSQSSSKKKRKTVNMMSSNTPTLDRFFSSS